MKPYHSSFHLAMISALACLTSSIVCSQNQPAVLHTDSNQALHLSGDGYIELPNDMLDGLEEITIECWVRWSDTLLPAPILSLARSNAAIELCGNPIGAQGLVLDLLESGCSFTKTTLCGWETHISFADAAQRQGGQPPGTRGVQGPLGPRGAPGSNLGLRAGPRKRA